MFKDFGECKRLSFKVCLQVYHLLTDASIRDETYVNRIYVSRLYKMIIFCRQGQLYHWTFASMHILCTSSA